MNEALDPGPGIHDGHFWFILIVSAVLTFLASMVLIRNYRRAVLKSMQDGLPGETPEPAHREASPASGRLEITTLDHAASLPMGPEAEALYSRLLRAPRRTVAVYTLAGGCFAAVMAAVFYLSGSLPFKVGGGLALCWIYAWPLVLTVGLAAASTRRARLALAGVYFGVMVVLEGLAVLVSTGGTVGQMAVLWLMTNLPITVLLLAFLNRKIRSPRALDLRLSEVDLAPDRDGRFRINEFFCHAHTWKAVLARLVGKSDTVLMDLRSFSPENAGCIFEIQALITTTALENVVFLIDETTDASFLRQTVQQAWRQRRPASPEGAVLRLVRFAGAQKGAFGQLLRTLSMAAAPSPAV